MKIVTIACLAIVTACVSNPNRYTGDTEYYWHDGKLWSCRESVCKPDSEWPDGGLSK